MDAPKDNKDKISPDPKRTKPGETPETTPEKSEERPSTSTSKKSPATVDSLKESLERIKYVVLPMADQQKYYYGIYFGLFETRGCRFIYEGTGIVEDLEYRMVNQNPFCDKKFLPILPTTADADQLEIAVGKAYLDAVKSYVDQSAEFIDGIAIVFPSLPRYLDVGALKRGVREHVNDKIRKTIDDQHDSRERVFVLKEKTMWADLVPNHENCAVLHISDYFFLTKGDLPSSTGIWGEEHTLEKIGESARRNIINKRRRLNEAEFQADALFGKAKEVFGVMSPDELMDAFRFRNTVPDVCRLAEAMAEAHYVNGVNGVIAKLGDEALTDIFKNMFKSSTPPGDFFIVVLGSVVEFFNAFSQKFVDEPTNRFKNVKYFSYKKPEMRNRAEVSAAVYAAKMDGRNLKYLELRELPFRP